MEHWAFDVVSTEAVMEAPLAHNIIRLRVHEKMITRQLQELKAENREVFGHMKFWMNLNERLALA